MVKNNEELKSAESIKEIEFVCDACNGLPLIFGKKIRF